MRGNECDYLLGEYIERIFWDLDAIEVPGTDGPHCRGRLHQIVPGKRENDALRDGAKKMSGSTDALKQSSQGTRRTKVTDQINMPHIDSQFERGSGYYDRHEAVFQVFLSTQPCGTGHAPMMCNYLILTKPLTKRVSNTFYKASRVGKDNGSAVGFDQPNETIIRFISDLMGGNGAELDIRSRNRKVQFPLVANIDNRALRRGMNATILPYKQPSNLRDGPLSGRQTNPLNLFPNQCIQALKSKCQMKAAFIACYGMYFIDYHGFDLVKDCPTLLSG